MAFKMKGSHHYGKNPLKRVGRGAPWWGLNKGNNDPIFHPHPHGSEGHIARGAKAIGKAGKAVGKAGKWVGRGIKKGIKNLGKIRIKGGGRGGYEMGPGGRGGWRG